MKKIRKLARKITVFWLPLVVWSVVIFFFSSHPVSRTSEFYWQDFVVKKIAHLVEYGVLSLLIFRALINEGMKKQGAGTAAVVLAIVYGISDELHQSLVPGRQSTLRDVIIDAIGAYLVVHYLCHCLSRAPKRVRLVANRLNLGTT